MQIAQFDKALVSFNRALSYKIKQDARHQLLWDVAWTHKKQNNLSAAIKVLQQLMHQVEKHDPLRRKYIFWQAYWHQQLGRVLESRLLFAELLNQSVLSYYSVLAYEQLAQQGGCEVVASSDRGGAAVPSSSPCGLLFGQALEKHRSGRGSDFLKALHHQLPLLKFLKQHRYKEALQAYVRHHITKIKKVDRVFLYSYVGQHQKALRSWANLGPRGKAYVVKNYLPQLFPEAYRVDVAQASRQFQTEPALLYAIMRQESAFHPQARSPMDAFGLMQMLPQVADRSFRKIKQVAYSLTVPGVEFASLPVAYQSEFDLYKPRNSIFLGAVHMAELLQQQGGNRVFSIASYNAGAHVVNKWKKFFAGPDFEFIEDIPYTETRRYTKLVLRNMAVYNYLYKHRGGRGDGRRSGGEFRRERPDIDAPGASPLLGVSGASGLSGWWSWLQFQREAAPPSLAAPPLATQPLAVPISLLPDIF